MKPVRLALAAMGLAQAAEAGELVVAHVGPFNGLAKHEGTRMRGRGEHKRWHERQHLTLVREDNHYKPEDTVQLLNEVAHS